MAGLISSPVAGRTDQIPLLAEADSYVIPADVVSGLGQGNTLGGAPLLDQIFSPHGVSPDANTNKASVTVNGQQMMGKGGHVRRRPIVVAGGEYMVRPAVVRSIGAHSLRAGGGRGDPVSEGHKILDRFVRTTRYNIAEHMRKLPGPRKD